MIRNLKIDTDLGYSYDSFEFEENFNMIQHDGYNTTSVAIYTDYGQLSGEYDLEEDCVIEDSRENQVKIKWALTRTGYYAYSDLYGTLDELIDDIGGVDHSNIEELYDTLDDLGIEYHSNYVRMSTRGYSQGDYAEILVNKREFRELVGRDFDPETYQTWFGHMFWDSMVYGTIEVGFEYTTEGGVNVEFEDEFEFQDWTKDPYDVDELDHEGLAKYIIARSPHKCLTEKDEEELVKALEKIDYTDIKYPCAC